ncbi:hypothetical protein HPP92_022791 [Vanilla planifolia]|uniref:BHLH domain-containing protein n=1 Tax=Vanilla planifolia TaxID=51239 RepID=A0A835PYY8_VANPL|nr:hypothetical protein HPP92_022791 [Vanilla planifolia]
MEFFSNEQCQPSLMDSIFLPDSPILVPLNLHKQAEELSRASLCFPPYCDQFEDIPGGSSSSVTECLIHSNNHKLQDSKSKTKGPSCVSSHVTGQQSKSKRGRAKKSSTRQKEIEEKQASTEYIHVRARRGQATDSHSLAERERRERISKRMKILQGLVPGCEKVTGKALVLDEIINYVECLKNQVEFLSMKLASVNPILCEYGLEFDDFTCPTELVSGDPNQQSPVIQSGCLQSQADRFSLMHSSSTPLLHKEGPTPFSEVKEKERKTWSDSRGAVERVTVGPSGEQEVDGRDWNASHYDALTAKPLFTGGAKRRGGLSSSKPSPPPRPEAFRGASVSASQHRQNRFLLVNDSGQGNTEEGTINMSIQTGSKVHFCCHHHHQITQDNRMPVPVVNKSRKKRSKMFRKKAFLIGAGNYRPQ